MNHHRVLIAAWLMCLWIGCQSDATITPVQKEQACLKYPPARTVNQMDDYHGTNVKDPYRWLEDIDSADARTWIEAENQVTFDYLKQIPTRETIRRRLTQLWNYERYGIPWKRGGRYFFFKNDGLQNQSVLYTLKTLKDEPIVLIDPNQLSQDGTVALSSLSVSEDGNLLAYSVSQSGSDWQEWKVRDINTGKDLSDLIQWTKFTSAAWTHDHKGFFYTRYPQPEQNDLKAQNYYPKLYYHRLGTDQANDVLVYERPDDKELGIGAGITDDGQYLVISISKGTEEKNRVAYKNLAAPDSTIVELISVPDAQYGFVGNDGPVFWFQTDLDASRGRIIAIDTRQPDRSNWKEVVSQSSDNLTGVSLVNNMFVASYLHDAQSRVRIHNLDGSFVRDVALPGVGSAGGFGGRREDTETFYAFTSFNDPSTVFHYDLATGQSEIFRRPQVDFNPNDYEAKQIFYASKDGTKIPMFIAHKKGLELNGRNPTLLYGYGGFNASLTPSFSVKNLIWMEMGGVYAMPNIRGGGEYGTEWHEAGMKTKRQNVYDDFIAAAQWLIDNHYTSPNKLAIHGGSNGGLLVGACMTQRPDLFAAALPAVGVLDMLRFNQFTIGHAWMSDYGSPDDPAEFKALYAYSPYHHLKPGTRYPATLITTADHDDRVFPAHSFKFAAALQAAQTGPNPVLIRIETKAGHGAGKPTTKIIEEATDQLAFLTRVLDMK